MTLTWTESVVVVGLVVGQGKVGSLREALR